MPGSSGFAVSQEMRGALPLLRVRGALDESTVPRLEEAILAVLNGTVSSVALDVSGVEFIDSTGVQVLMSAKKRTAERGGSVYVLGVRDQLERVFTLLRLEQVFVLCRETDLPQL